MENSNVTVTMGEGYYATAKSRHHEWYADLPVENGGTDEAPTPEELVMGTLGSCMLQTAKLYAARKGWQIDHMTVKLNFERFRADDYPGYSGDAKFVHEVRELIEVEGPLDAEQIKRIVEIMGKCPIRRLIEYPAVFVHADPENA
jgi:uncharacterized OsmC-like protein